MAWLTSPEPPSVALPVPTVDDILTRPGLAEAQSPVEFLMQQMAIDPASSCQVEEMTRGQADNPLWSVYRRGRLTASNFGPVVRCLNSNRKPSQSLLHTLLGTKDLSKMRAVQWGKNNESTARDLYSELQEVEVQQRGLFLHTSGILAASPDGLVSDSKVIEIKCPFSLRDKSITSAVGDGFYVKTVGAGEYELNLSDTSGFNYYHQIQGVMHMTNTTECDFIVWSPVDFLIFTVDRDSLWSENVPKLISFYKEHVAPKLIST